MKTDIATPTSMSEETIDSQQLDPEVEELTEQLQPIFEVLRSFADNVFRLQTLWALSHVLTILGTVVFALTLWLNGHERLNQTSYYVSVWSSVLTYLVVIYRSSLSQFDEEDVLDTQELGDSKTDHIDHLVIPLSELLKDENSHLLGYSLLWLTTSKSIIKLVPFYLYSLLNITNFFTTFVFPNTALSDAILPLINYFEIPILIVASYFELLIFVSLGKECFLEKNFYPYAIFAFIWCLRFEISEASRSASASIFNIFSKSLNHIKIFELIRFIVSAFKSLVFPVGSFLESKLESTAVLVTKLRQKPEEGTTEVNEVIFLVEKSVDGE